MYVFCICLFDVFNYFLFDVVNYGVIWDDFKKNDFFLFHFFGVTLLVLQMQECSFKKIFMHLIQIIVNLIQKIISEGS